MTKGHGTLGHDPGPASVLSATSRNSLIGNHIASCRRTALQERHALDAIGAKFEMK